MKTAIIYRSFFWTTKQYAQWLKDALDCDLFVFKGMSSQKLTEYDTIVVCSGTYAGWMPLVGFIKKWWEILKEKRVIAVAIGISPIDEINFGSFFRQLPETIEKNIKIFKISDKITCSEKTKKEGLKQIIQYIKGGEAV